MGRSGYNGGADGAESPKKDLYILDTGQGENEGIPSDFTILQSGINLVNEFGATQAEFGYIVHITVPEQDNRLDFSSFINTMDDAAFAYFSLVREYASRKLQGNALQYEGLYKALVAQSAEDEKYCRCSVIEFLPDGTRSRTFAGYKEFKMYMETHTEAGAPGRLFIIEDLAVRFVCVLGSRLRIHPSVFASHYSIEDGSVVSDNIVAFPSIDEHVTADGLEYSSLNGMPLDDGNRRFQLLYPISLPAMTAKQNPDPNLCPPWLKPVERLTDQCAYPKFLVERVLSTPSPQHKWDAGGEVWHMEGQVTYWSQVLPSGGWNGVCLADPCLKDPSLLAIINGAFHPNLSRKIRYPELDDHRKVDIASNPAQWHPSAAFTKYILHDDLLTHFSVASTGPGSNPLAATPFIRGFAISKWTAYLNHVRRCLAHTRSVLFDPQNSHERTDAPALEQDPRRNIARWGADWQEWIFESITRLNIELSSSRLDVEVNMRSLGIDVYDRNCYGFVGKREAQIWHYIRTTCLDLQQMYQDLANSYTQVVALREAQVSNAQASSVGWLTVLGTFFVPLSVVSGVMSMGADFLPGQRRFWIYFAVVGPLMILIGIIMVLVLSGGDTNKRLRSLFKKTARGGPPKYAEVDKSKMV
ncbi:MAG: hypothetical protein Q9165_005384 [Trypethelium subeluteriae]